jgi:hypothetical protein
MAVIVQCFHCNAILELDDGFRGGVCRCSTCGSLLQVPHGESDGMVPRKKKVRPAKPMPHVPTAPVGNSNGGRVADTGISSGQLDPRRADIGVSSGLGRIHPTRPITHTSSKRSGPREVAVHPAQRVAQELRANRRLFWLGILLAVIIVAAGGVACWYYFYF